MRLLISPRYIKYTILLLNTPHNNHNYQIILQTEPLLSPLVHSPTYLSYNSYICHNSKTTELQGKSVRTKNIPRLMQIMIYTIYLIRRAWKLRNLQGEETMVMAMA